MKLKLPCCEINKKSPNKHWECGYCECVFENLQLLNGHNHETHAMQLANKRKLDCCEHNEKKRQKTDHHLCHYCECTFRWKFTREQHVNDVHTCSTCYDIILTDGVRAIHNAKHKQEAQLERLQKQHQRKMDDDFVLCYVKANRLDEYQPSSEYEPNFDYIFNDCGVEREELLRLVKTFKDEFLDLFTGCFYEFQFGYADLIYLVENGALSTEDLAYFQDCLESFDVDTSMLEYLLDKDYEIKPEWVANVIENDELVERIKQKHTFTFDEIYEAREFVYDDDGHRRNTFYVQVHRHFPNENFEDPFADPYENFKRVTTEHVKDHLFRRYFYDRENDKLSIVVGDENQREIPLGRCSEMSTKSLEVLVKEYDEAVKIYDELNDRVSDLFDEREDELDKASKQSERESVLDYYHDEIYKDALPDRNHQANIVSKLYFVISLK